MFCLLGLGDNMDWLVLFIILLLQLSLWISSEQKLDACGLEGRSEADAIFLILFGNFFWYASSWKRRVLCSSISLLVFQLPKSKVDESRWQYVLKKGEGGRGIFLSSQLHSYVPCCSLGVSAFLCSFGFSWKASLKSDSPPFLIIM